jgi:hypothetical protein
MPLQLRQVRVVQAEAVQVALLEVLVLLVALVVFFCSTNSEEIKWQD